MDKESQLYALIYSILCGGLEHLWIWGTHRGSWNQSPADIKGQLSFGEVKIYTQIFDYVGGMVSMGVSTPNSCIVQRSIVTPRPSGLPEREARILPHLESL